MTTRYLNKLIGGPAHGMKFVAQHRIAGEPLEVVVPFEPLRGYVECCPAHAPDADLSYRTVRYQQACWIPGGPSLALNPDGGDHVAMLRFWAWDQLSLSASIELAWLFLLEEAGLGV